MSRPRKLSASRTLRTALRMMRLSLVRREIAEGALLASIPKGVASDS